MVAVATLQAFQAGTAMAGQHLPFVPEIIRQQAAFVPVGGPCDTTLPNLAGEIQCQINLPALAFMAHAAAASAYLRIGLKKTGARAPACPLRAAPGQRIGYPVTRIEDFCADTD